MIRKTLKAEVLELKATDKLRLVELLIDSLDQPDPHIEQLWIKESEARYSSYKKGNVSFGHSCEGRNLIKEGNRFLPSQE